MSDITVHFYDYSHVIIKSNVAITAELNDKYSFFQDGYQFSPKFKYGSWDGKQYIFEKTSPSSGMLPFGLLPNLVDYAKNSEYTISLDDSFSLKYELSHYDFMDWINSKTYYSGDDEITPYWYQTNAIYQGLTNKRRILNLPTSAGKSLIQALLTKYTIEHSDYSVLILVPTTALVTQMKDDLVDYRLFEPEEIATVYSGAPKQKNERVVISTWQSAVKKPKNWFSKFGMFLCDEMHLAISSSISSIIKRLTACEYKIGLSGSLRDGKANLMQYVGLFGGIYNPVTTSELMDAGQVTKLKINCIFLKYDHKPLDYQDEIKHITGCERRTNWVANLAKKLADKQENVFVMFRRKDHGKWITNILKSLGCDVHYVAGEVDVDERDRLKKLAEQSKGMIIVASYGVFSTGISVKNLHHVIFAHPIKSKTTMLQTIGRVLRKHKSKDIATLWDIIDDMSTVNIVDGVKYRKNVNYALTHAAERIERYKLELFNYELKKVDLFK